MFIGKISENAPSKVSFCGRVGSFSHDAAVQMFPESVEYIGCDTFVEAITMVEFGDVTHAVIPIENSTAGRVAEIHNILPNLNLYIVQEKIIQIVHNLYVLHDGISLEDLRVVRSHPQALMQCSNFLSSIGIETDNALNTAIAAEELSKKRESYVGVVCSAVAGRHYNLHLLKESIQNSDDNSTIFIALGRQPNQAVCTKPLTSIIFEISNKSGGVYEALGCFAKYNINLLKLESYIPVGVSSKIAKFLITFQGSNSDNATQNALRELGLLAVEIKNLGTYEGDISRFV